MKLSEVMSTDVETIPVEATLRQAANTMASRDLGWLPVVDGDNRFVGVVTDRDLTVRGIAQGRNPETALVREVMRPGVRSVSADEDVKAAARVLVEDKLRKVAVVGQGAEVIGFVSPADLSRASGMWAAKKGSRREFPDASTD